MTFLDKVLYYILFGLWYAVSLLPMWWHYFWSDVLCALVYHVVRYRRKMVRKNLTDSFPDKSEAEIVKVEKGFYHYFADIVVESIKFISLSPSQLKHRMVFENTEIVAESCKRGKNVAFFLGHYGNWEWISSFGLWLDPKVGKGMQLYHPLENPVMDKLMGYVRQRNLCVNVPVEQSIRHFVKYRREGVPIVVGFIADQAPFWNNIHYWTHFLNHPKTPIFSGPERLAKQFDMDCYFLHVTRVKRGYWTVKFIEMCKDAKGTQEFEITEKYTRMLEQNILDAPQYWLWSHNRWKRTYEEWLKKVDPKTGRVLMK